MHFLHVGAQVVTALMDGTREAASRELTSAGGPHRRRESDMLRIRLPRQFVNESEVLLITLMSGEDSRRGAA
jgi:hypothetical protein